MLQCRSGSLLWSCLLSSNTRCCVPLVSIVPPMWGIDPPIIAIQISYNLLESLRYVLALNLHLPVTTKEVIAMKTLLITISLLCLSCSSDSSTIADVSAEAVVNASTCAATSDMCLASCGLDLQCQIDCKQDYFSCIGAIPSGCAAAAAACEQTCDPTDVQCLEDCKEEFDLCSSPVAYNQCVSDQTQQCSAQCADAQCEEDCEVEAFQDCQYIVGVPTTGGSVTPGSTPSTGGTQNAMCMTQCMATCQAMNPSQGGVTVDCDQLCTARCI